MPTSAPLDGAECAMDVPFAVTEWHKHIGR